MNTEAIPTAAPLTIGTQFSVVTLIPPCRWRTPRLTAVPTNSLGLNINTNFNRRFGAWIANGNFNYSQNAETLLVTYTTSQYGYGGGLRTALGKSELEPQRRGQPVRPDRPFGHNQPK